MGSFVSKDRENVVKEREKSGVLHVHYGKIRCPVKVQSGSAQTISDLPGLLEQNLELPVHYSLTYNGYECTEAEARTVALRQVIEENIVVKIQTSSFDGSRMADGRIARKPASQVFFARDPSSSSNGALRETAAASARPRIETLQRAGQKHQSSVPLDLPLKAAPASKRPKKHATRRSSEVALNSTDVRVRASKPAPIHTTEGGDLRDGLTLSDLPVLNPKSSPTDEAQVAESNGVPSSGSDARDSKRPPLLTTSVAPTKVSVFSCESRGGLARLGVIILTVSSCGSQLFSRPSAKETLLLRDAAINRHSSGPGKKSRVSISPHGFSTPLARRLTESEEAAPPACSKTTFVGRGASPSLQGRGSSDEDDEVVPDSPVSRLDQEYGESRAMPANPLQPEVLDLTYSTDEEDD
jgi:hypothetical protein